MHKRTLIHSLRRCCGGGDAALFGTSLVMKLALIKGVEIFVLTLMPIFPDYLAILSCLTGAPTVVGVS
jgi:DUF917 family protein